MPKTWAKSRGASFATQPAQETISVNLFFILLFIPIYSIPLALLLQMHLKSKHNSNGGSFFLFYRLKRRLGKNWIDDFSSSGNPEIKSLCEWG
jgi:hypothetical protein